MKVPDFLDGAEISPVTVRVIQNLPEDFDLDEWAFKAVAYEGSNTDIGFGWELIELAGLETFGPRSTETCRMVGREVMDGFSKWMG